MIFVVVDYVLIFINTYIDFPQYIIEYKLGTCPQIIIMKKLISIITLFAFLSSCASIEYVSDHLIEDGINGFKTYKIDDYCDADINTDIKETIKKSVNKNMADLGYNVSDSPDIIVQYFVKSIPREATIQDCNVDYDQWEGGVVCKDKVITYEEGSMVIDFINNKTQEIIWHGAIRGLSLHEWRISKKQLDEKIAHLLQLAIHPT